LIPFLWVSCPSEEKDEGGVSLDKTTVTMLAGTTEKLTATVTTPIKTIRWSSSDEKIVTVSAGTITAQATGTAVITVSLKADKTKKATCEVTVTGRSTTNIGAKDGLSGKTAAEYFKANNVLIGWNLGNAFDADSGYGTWTRKIDKDFLPKVKAAGYSMVRIPVTWRTIIGAAPDYTFKADKIAELVQVVDWAYDAGLVTIINIHHDDKDWLDMKKLMVEADRPKIYDQFEKIWGQIADKFKDYGDWLIFEPFNELHDGGWGWNPQDVELTIINELNQKFTTKVRAAGGKNAERFLVVQPLCAKPHQALADTFKLPTDTVKNKQIVSMHFYEPEAFALNGMDNGKDVLEWGAVAREKNDMSSKFSSYAEKFSQKGIPIIFGECGATYQNRTDATKSSTAAASRLVYMDYMCKKAKENGIIPIYWDNGTTSASSVGENFGLWDRRPSGDLKVIPGMQIVIDTMINAVQ